MYLKGVLNVYSILRIVSIVQHEVKALWDTVIKSSTWPLRNQRDFYQEFNMTFDAYERLVSRVQHDLWAIWETGIKSSTGPLMLMRDCFRYGFLVELCRHHFWLDGTRWVTILEWVIMVFWGLPFYFYLFPSGHYFILMIAINVSRLLCRALQTYK